MDRDNTSVERLTLKDLNNTKQLLPIAFEDIINISFWVIVLSEGLSTSLQ